MKALLRGCLVVPVLGVLALAACSKKGNGPPPPPPEVGVVTAQSTVVPLTKDLVGRVSAFRTADVYARVPGILLKRTYKEGTEVKAGQLLFQIDPAPLQAVLNSARAQLAQASANYTNAHIQAQQAIALAPKGYVSKTDLNNALAAERSDQAAVQAAQANVDTARINLGYASVTSPIAGRAGQQQVTEGALVSQSTPTLLTKVDQIDPLYVNFTIGVADLDELQRAQQVGSLQLNQPDKSTVQVKLPDGTPYAETGTVDFSSVNVDPATGAVNLRALLPNPQHRLLPGSYVTLTLTLGERRGAFLIPQPAVQTDPSGNYVFVVGKDGKVGRQDVTTSGTDGNDWVVTSGLKSGDAVVVSGVQVVRQGASAKAVPWQPPASAGSSGAPAASAPAGPSASG